MDRHGPLVGNVSGEFTRVQCMANEKGRLIAGERQRAIVRLVVEAGSIRIGDLVETFDVSDETIRRDLAVLEEQGLLTRTHGGAISEGVHRETTFQRRAREFTDEKDAIGRAAADFVEDGSTIILDSGTTMRHFATHLRSKRDLVVITNGITNTNELLANPSLTLVLTGGVVRRATVGASGELAVATLKSLRADHTFIATHGFSALAGMTYPSFEEVAAKRAMIEAGARVTLLADGSKCGRESMVRVAPLNVVHRIITSNPIPDDEQARIRDLGIELIITAAANERGEDKAAR
jgi:DeoR family fructose operon transcriptional repressor